MHEHRHRAACSSRQPCPDGAAGPGSGALPSVACPGGSAPHGVACPSSSALPGVASLVAAPSPVRLQQLHRHPFLGVPRPASALPRRGFGERAPVRPTPASPRCGSHGSSVLPRRGYRKHAPAPPSLCFGRQWNWGYILASVAGVNHEIWVVWKLVAT
jgi:hypothetical protein